MKGLGKEVDIIFICTPMEDWNYECEMRLRELDNSEEYLVHKAQNFLRYFLSSRRRRKAFQFLLVSES